MRGAKRLEDRCWVLLEGAVEGLVEGGLMIES
jgi:hypothetical protein